MKNKVKLIMTDLDGTLLTTDKKVSEYNKQAIKKAKEKGILFGIATGRTLYAVERLLQEWGIEDLVDILIGMNGSQRWNYVTNTKESSDDLDTKYMIEILERTKHLDVVSCVYKDDTREIVADEINDQITRIAVNNHYTAVKVDMKEYLVGKKFDKFILSCNPAYMETLKKECVSLNTENYRGFCTGEILYEFMNPIVSKSYGISKVSESLEFTIEDVLAFGDNSNDIEMIRDAGFGVCMINGSEDAKEVAKYITKCSNDESGLGKFIEENLL